MWRLWQASLQCDGNVTGEADKGQSGTHVSLTNGCLD